MRVTAAVVVFLTATAHAGIVDGPFTFVNSDSATLVANGFANLTADGPLQSVPTGTCAGCYTLPSLRGQLPLKAFFQYEIVGGLPTVNDGAFAVLTFDFADPTFGVNEFINVVDGFAAQAYDIYYSSNPSCSFDDFLDPSVYNAANTVVFRWTATPGQSLFTFGWDLTAGSGLTSLFPGVSVTGAGGVPAPGALALVSLAGLLSARRRR